MKESLRGIKFNSNEEVKKKRQNWLGNQRKEFFAEGKTHKKMEQVHRSWWGLRGKIDKKLY